MVGRLLSFWERQAACLFSGQAVGFREGRCTAHCAELCWIRTKVTSSTKISWIRDWKIRPQDPDHLHLAWWIMVEFEVTFLRSKWWLSGDCVLETISFPIYFPDVSIVDQMSTPETHLSCWAKPFRIFTIITPSLFFKTNESSGKFVNHPFTMCGRWFSIHEDLISMRNHLPSRLGLRPPQKQRPRRGVCGQSSLEICGSLRIFIASGLLGRRFFSIWIEMVPRDARYQKRLDLIFVAQTNFVNKNHLQTIFKNRYINGRGWLCCHFISSSYCGSRCTIHPINPQQTDATWGG